MELNSIVSNSEIGAVIKRRRNELLWSLEKLGTMLHVSAKQIQRYESGANSLTVEKFQEIALALSMPLCYFFHDGFSQKTAKPNECYKFFSNFRNLHNNDMKALVIDFVRIAAQNGDKSRCSGVAAR